MKRYVAVFAGCLTSCSLLGCADIDALDDFESELLFGLTEAELVQIHDTYRQGEALELTREQLSGPFDCADYDDLCERLGEHETYLLGVELVDMALDAVPLEQINAHVADRVASAPLPEPGVDEGFRFATVWKTVKTGNYRMRVRNRIFTPPVVGDRQAGTEARTQYKFGVTWVDMDADQLCTDTGANTQTQLTTVNSETHALELESSNPGETCGSDTSYRWQWTNHERKVMSTSSWIKTKYRVTARGCASASIGGHDFSACANALFVTF